MSNDRRREIVIMGTGTSVGVPMSGCDCAVCTSENPRNHRTRTGVLVRAPEGDFVIDTPPELRLQLLREKVKLIQAAVFTHSHADHIMGLDDLRIFGYLFGAPIPLYCDEFTEGQIRMTFHYAFAEPSANAHHFSKPNLRFERFSNSPFELLEQRIVPIPLLHGDLPLFGFRIADFAFCTDVSKIPEESWPLLEGLDVLVLDALRDRPHPTHFNVEQAVDVIERLKPKRAYLTHISHALDYDDTNARLPDHVELAYDGLKISY